MTGIVAAAARTATLRDAEHALDAADRTTDTQADRTANQTADRASSSITLANTLVSALFGATENTLRLRQVRHRDDREDTGSQNEAGFD